MKGKEGLALLIGQGFKEELKKRKKDKDPEISSDDESADEKVQLAEELMDSLDSGDAESFSDALESFILACKEEY